MYISNVGGGEMPSIEIAEEGKNPESMEVGHGGKEVCKDLLR